MISYLLGTFLFRDDDRITVLPDGSGIGYEVFVPARIGTFLIRDERIELFIHMQTSETTGSTLFGFRTVEDRTLFRRLIRVSGIGGKTAIHILDLGVESITRAIAAGDDTFFSGISGIGKKLSRKIIAELHEGTLPPISTKNAVSHTPQNDDDTDGAIHDTLISLGYPRTQVDRVLRQIPTDLEDIEARTLYAIQALSSFHKKSV